MHVFSRLLAVELMISLISAIVIPESVPDSTPNGAVLPITPPAAAAAATTSQSGPPEQQQHEQPQNMNIRILVCGDSITQGVEGQFTWRYRLWEWFHNNTESHTENHAQTLSSSASSAEADNRNSTYQYPTMHYVGPYNGTLPSTNNPSTGPGRPSTGSTASASTSISISASAPDPYHPKTWGSYHPGVDAAFSPGGGSAHFAVYGRPAWQDVDLLGDQVQAYQPDFVVLHLGFNDIGWWGHRPADLVETMQKLVFRARLARRDVAVLIADVSHRVAVGGREDIPLTTDEYNQAIVDKAREWSTAGSPVEVVRVSEVYDCHIDSCPAGFDGLHPNSLGDFQIARAYTQVFHEKFGFGDGMLEVPRLNDIPGMSSYSGLSTAVNAAVSSPVLFMGTGVILLCLVLATVLRPELLRLKRFGKGKYRLLPSA